MKHQPILIALIAALFGLSATNADTVNAKKQSSVQRYFLRHYQPQSKKHFHWSGSSDSPEPGTLSPGFVDALTKRLNYFRAMSGIPLLGASGALANQAQFAAHIHGANNDVDFNLATPDLRFYSQQAADACAVSDVFWQLDDTPYSVDYWLTGADYYSAFPLNPTLSAVGWGGAAAGGAQLEEYHYAVIFAGSFSMTSRNGFVAFPPAGYAPLEAYGHAAYLKLYVTSGSAVDVSHATVALKINGRRAHAILESNTTRTANDPRLLTITSDRLFAVQNARKLQNVTVNVTGVLVDGVEVSYRWRTNYFQAARK